MGRPSPNRCEHSGNPCGTDTWVAGIPCHCQSCATWLLAEVERLRGEVADHEEARLCVVCAGHICPPMTCTGCQLHRGEATAVTDHELRKECDKLRAEVERLREYNADLASRIEQLQEAYESVSKGQSKLKDGK